MIEVLQIIGRSIVVSLPVAWWFFLALYLVPKMMPDEMREDAGMRTMGSFMIATVATILSVMAVFFVAMSFYWIATGVPLVEGRYAHG